MNIQQKDVTECIKTPSSWQTRRIAGEAEIRKTIEGKEHLKQQGNIAARNFRKELVAREIRKSNITIVGSSSLFIACVIAEDISFLISINFLEKTRPSENKAYCHCSAVITI